MATMTTPKKPRTKRPFYYQCIMPQTPEGRAWLELPVIAIDNRRERWPLGRQVTCLHTLRVYGPWQFMGDDNKLISRAADIIKTDRPIAACYLQDVTKSVSRPKISYSEGRTVARVNRSKTCHAKMELIEPQNVTADIASRAIDPQDRFGPGAYWGESMFDPQTGSSDVELPEDTKAFMQSVEDERAEPEEVKPVPEPAA